VIIDPKKDTACPIHNMRKSRDARSGAVSINRPDNFELSMKPTRDERSEAA